MNCYINIHTHSLQSEGFEILNVYPFQETDGYFSKGIHPWYIHENSIEDELLDIEQSLQNPKCLAVGECGLDKITETDLQLQTAVFRKQIGLSEKYQKPIIIHCVKAFQEIISLKKELQPKQKWIIHGFNKNERIANQLIENDFYLSFGKALLFNEKLQETFKTIPLDRIFFEIDDSETSIEDIYKKAIEIKGVSFLELEGQIRKNLKISNLIQYFAI